MIRRVINERRLRLWVAGTYALLPVLLGGHQPGPAGAVRGGHRAAAADLRRPGAGPAPGGYPRGLARRVGRRGRPRRAGRLRALADHSGHRAGRPGCRRAPADAAQDRPDRHRPGPAAGRAGAVVAERSREPPAGCSSVRTPPWAVHPRPPRSGRCCWAARRVRGCPRCGSARWSSASSGWSALLGLVRRPERRAVVSAWIVALLGLGHGGGAVPAGRHRASGRHRGPAVGRHLPAGRVRCAARRWRRRGGRAGSARCASAASAGCSRPPCWPPSRSAWSAWAVRSGGWWRAPPGRSTGPGSTPSRRTC